MYSQIDARRRLTELTPPSCISQAATTHTPQPTTAEEREHGSSYVGGFAEILKELCNENRFLHQQVSRANERCSILEAELESVKRTLADIRAAPPQPRQTAQKIWHQRANNIIGAEHSRCAPTHEYGCAHDGCTWKDKKVTLQAYILHLQ